VLVEYYFPQSLSPARLDRYLAGGWFRSGPSLFRARLLCLGGNLYEVTNIRVDLENYSLSRSLRRIQNRAKRDLRVEVGPVRIDSDRERLYRQHKHRFKGFIFETLEEFLFSGESHSLFHTLEISVYLENQLIAVSYFDQGFSSLASLLGLYDRQMGRYSLGLLTMLMEIEYAKQEGCRYYYPGYVLEGYPGFDYKMRLGGIQYYNWNGRWRPAEYLKSETSLVTFLNEKMDEVEVLLKDALIPSQRVLYPFFSLGYMGIIEEDFLRSPMYIVLEDQKSIQNRPYDSVLVVEYVAEEQLYQLSRVRRDFDYADIISAEFSDDYFELNPSQTGLLIREEIYIRHRDPRRVIQFAQEYESSFGAMP